jgi:hypothetical protein
MFAFFRFTAGASVDGDPVGRAADQLLKDFFRDEGASGATDVLINRNITDMKIFSGENGPYQYGYKPAYHRPPGHFCAERRQGPYSP